MYTSRQNPSKRFDELRYLNTLMHLNGEQFQKLSAEKTFTGQSLYPHIPRIQEMIDKTESSSLLDYGCGKATAYDGDIPFHNIELVRLYDPCYPPYNTVPESKFDGVICTDVLEHCPKEDLEDWIVRELFEYAHKFVYINVSTRLAGKRLSNGDNAHETVMPLSWWTELIERTAKDFPNVVFAVHES